MPQCDDKLFGVRKSHGARDTVTKIFSGPPKQKRRRGRQGHGAVFVFQVVIA